MIVLLIVFWNRKLSKQITIANNATEALRKAQDQLYNILNTSPIAASVIVDDQVRYANDTAKRLFGVGRKNSLLSMLKLFMTLCLIVMRFTKS